MKKALDTTADLILRWEAKVQSLKEEFEAIPKEQYLVAEFRRIEWQTQLRCLDQLKLVAKKE